MRQAYVLKLEANTSDELIAISANKTQSQLVRNAARAALNARGAKP